MMDRRTFLKLSAGALALAAAWVMRRIPILRRIL